MISTEKNTSYYILVDLHGFSPTDAQNKLEYWLSTSASKRIDHIRFVTGRGNHINTKGERGTLYKNFLEWIEKSAYKERVERCDQHDGYFEITLKSIQKQSPLTNFFNALGKQLIAANHETIKKLAEEGEVYSQWLYGKMLEKGDGVKQDFKEAVKFYTLAANNQYPAAMHELARCYSHGVGVRQNDAKAVEWLKKADQLDYIDSTVILGDSYWYGTGVKEDNRMAISYFAKAAAHKHPVAMRRIAGAYNQGAEVEKKPEIAFMWYKKAADLGDVISQYNVGTMYQNGVGVQKNEKEAWRYFLMAAENGDPDAQCAVGCLYLEGRGIKKDLTTAIQWLEKAAANGSKQAMHQLSMICDDQAKEIYLKKSADAGNFMDQAYLNAANVTKQKFDELIMKGIEKNRRLPIDDIKSLEHETKYILLDWMLTEGKKNDKEKALKAIEEMAENNSIFSLRRLFQLYAIGYEPNFKKKDMKKAIDYLKKACELGDSKSMVHLSYLYEKGLTVTQSLPTAVSLYQQAAELNNPIACCNLAILYTNGIGVTQDGEKALYYSARAISLEKEEGIISSLSSGFIDTYAPTSEKALTILNHTKQCKIDYLQSINRFYKASTQKIQMAAESGDPDAQCALGCLYLEGKGVTKDSANAIQWLEKAAANGSNQALHYLSILKDEESDYLKKSVAAGNFMDEIHMNAATLTEQQRKKIFREGIEKNRRLPIDDIKSLEHKTKFMVLDKMLMEGKKDDKEKAFKAIEEMAENKCIFSLRRLFLIYANVFDQPKIKKKDLKKAIDYLQIACELGDSKSMVHLGHLYEKGQEVTPSLPTAVSLYQQATELDNPTAYYYLAILHLKDSRRTRDLKMAIQYLDTAILLEKNQHVTRFLGSGLLDGYATITENALLLYSELDAYLNPKDQSDKILAEKAPTNKEEADESKENQQVPKI